MNIILIGLRLLLFIISLIGLFVLIKNKTKVKLEFVPIITMSLIICILLIAGFLNILLYAVYGVFLTGIGFFIYYFKKKQLVQFEKQYLPYGMIFIIVISIVYTLIFTNFRLSHYDNFSHWALIVKDMLIYNRLPNSLSSSILSFKAYPPGSALFIYYTTRIVGFSEWIMITAQFYLMLACVLPVFAFAKSKMTSIILMLAVVGMLFIIQPFNLIVDSLLGLFGVASSAIIVYYRNDLKKACLFTIPVLCAVVMVKNSGIFFVVIGILLLFYFKRKNVNKTIIESKKELFYIFICIIIPMIVVWLWSRHVDFTFPNTISKHSMSFSNFSKVFGDKSNTDIVLILKLLVKKFIDIKSKYFQTIVTYIVCMSSLILYIRLHVKEKAKILTHVLIFSAIVFILYYIGLAAMFVFSMPNNEALRLAGYHRYLITVYIYIFLVTIMLCTIILEQISKITSVKTNRVIITGFTVFVMLFMSVFYGFKHPVFYVNTQDTSYITTRIRAAANENLTGYSNASYCIYDTSYNSEDDYGYLSYFLKYYFFTTGKKNHVSTFEAYNTFIDYISDYDYLVVSEEDKLIREYLSRHYNKNSYIGTYDISEIIGE